MGRTDENGSWSTEGPVRMNLPENIFKADCDDIL